VNKLIVLLLLLSACTTEGPNPLYIPQPGYPCGVGGFNCMEPNAEGIVVASTDCCDNGQVCGGPFPNVGCPADFCCDEMLGGRGKMRVVKRKYKAGKP
jgi:hypothetical protein